ncbi:MAG TPA: hypothetical protein VH877_00725, partial [Polyangia bacterium]|nr:hypothetical protein [Polyangia bacterium]
RCRGASMKIHVLWMVLPALLLGGAWVDRAMTRERHRAELARRDGELGALVRARDELEARVAVLELTRRHLEVRLENRAGVVTRGGTPVAPPSPSPAVAASGAPEGPAAGEAAKAPAAPEPAAVVQALDRAFAAEPLDASWSAATDSAMRGRLATLTTGRSSVRSLECRSSLCRLEVVHDDAAQSSAFTERAFAGAEAPLWIGTYVQTRVATPDGKEATVAYLVRGGRELPRLE